MKICGVIAEYNPFHSGHLYHLNESKRLTGADYIVAVMSGDFIQRGGPAFIDKYTRARMALKAGADLVLELPAMAATSNAEIFASCAVSLFDKMGCVDFLSFGCEDADLRLFNEIAAVLNSEPGDYINCLQKALSEGLGYPAARQLALIKTLPEDLYGYDPAELIKKPNNILAIEYCRALDACSSSMQAVPVKRQGAGHDDKKASYLSASAMLIRESISSGNISVVDSFMPSFAGDILKDYLSETPYISLDDFSQMIIHCVLNAKGELTKYCDINDDMANRLEKTVTKAISLTQLCDECQSKNLTRARIRRCLFHILLSHRKDLLEKWKKDSYSGYVNVLGFKKDSEAVFSAIRDDFRSKMIMRSSMRSCLRGTASQISENDLFCSEIYRAILRTKYHIKTKTVLSEPVIVLR